MNKIELQVNDENLESVLMILGNLKSGLISEIICNAQKTKSQTTRYQPKTSKVIYEDQSGTNDSNGKYVSVSAYKQRLKK